MNVTQYLRVGTFCFALMLIGAGLGSCRKKTISVDEARASLEEIKSFSPTLHQQVTASEMLTLVEGLTATSPLSRLVKEHLVPTIREEVEIEKWILKITGFFGIR